jgi:hypothetical protein
VYRKTEEETKKQKQIIRCTPRQKQAGGFFHRKIPKALQLLPLYKTKALNGLEMSSFM